MTIFCYKNQHIAYLLMPTLCVNHYYHDDVHDNDIVKFNL